MLPVVLAIAVVTVILTMAFAGTATGQSSTMTLITVTGADFTPDDNGCDYHRSDYSGEINDDSGCAMEGSLQLPQGSTITGVFVFYRSNGTQGRQFHLEENFWTGDHNDIAQVDLPTCEPASELQPCVGFQITDFDSPDVLNGPFGYAGWLDSGDPGFTLYKIVIRVSIPSSAGSPNPLSPPARLPTPDTNPH